MTPHPVDVAVVLPAGERFSPTAAGAIALLVYRTTRRPADHSCVVVGTECAAPFQNVPFLGITERRLPVRAAWRYAFAIARALPVPRLIEVHNRADVALALSRLFPSVPVTLFCHNDPLSMRGMRTHRARIRALKRLYAVAGVSRFIIEPLRSTLPHADPVVIPNGIDPVTDVPAEAAREKLIMFAGRMVGNKGADAFVEACARALPQLPGWRAEMIGADRFGHDSPETEFLGRLRPRAAAAGVSLLGFLPHDAVMAAMRRAAIVAVPSRWAEPFGLTALEAMASGAALVSSRRGGLAELVDDAAEICDPDDIPGFSAILTRLANDEALRRNLARAGVVRASHYTTERMAAGLWAWRGRALNRHDQEAI